MIADIHGTTVDDIHSEYWFQNIALFNKMPLSSRQVPLWIQFHIWRHYKVAGKIDTVMMSSVPKFYILLSNAPGKPGQCIFIGYTSHIL